ncbi:ABC transporter [Streptomyces sp. H27-D2]|uniref:ABC transporter n=1 Tax=Streptomyces sp. H27-D2 TaxID=3046304 RepID=UPI002DBF256A|nr:ABC transporter [Streptomyces sp. H27-D2]MEC4021056.1 ABC transporter [Streptomyces sp. H27-D2]
MTALLRYQAALLLRSHRWLPPVLLYVVFLVVGVQGGQPILDSLGYAAAALLPATAWLVRICVTNEPAAARNCCAAATSPARVHLACVLTALGFAVALGTVATLLVALISDPKSTDGQVRVPPLSAAGAGLLAMLACVLCGLAVGVLCNWPLLRSSGWAVLSTMMAALMVLVVSGSPANAAMKGLVTGSAHGTVPMPLLPFVVGAVAAGAATAVGCVLSSRRS